MRLARIAVFTTLAWSCSCSAGPILRSFASTLGLVSSQDDFSPPLASVEVSQSQSQSSVVYYLLNFGYVPTDFRLDKPFDQTFTSHYVARDRIFKCGRLIFIFIRNLNHLNLDAHIGNDHFLKQRYGITCYFNHGLFDAYIRNGHNIEYCGDNIFTVSTAIGELDIFQQCRSVIVHFLIHLPGYCISIINRTRIFRNPLHIAFGSFKGTFDHTCTFCFSSYFSSVYFCYIITHNFKSSADFRITSQDSLFFLIFVLSILYIYFFSFVFNLFLALCAQFAGRKYIDIYRYRTFFFVQVHRRLDNRTRSSICFNCPRPSDNLPSFFHVPRRGISPSAGNLYNTGIHGIRVCADEFSNSPDNSGIIDSVEYYEQHFSSWSIDHTIETSSAPAGAASTLSSTPTPNTSEMSTTTSSATPTPEQDAVTIQATRTTEDTITVPGTTATVTRSPNPDEDTVTIQATRTTEDTLTVPGTTATVTKTPTPSSTTEEDTLTVHSTRTTENTVTVPGTTATVTRTPTPTSEQVETITIKSTKTEEQTLIIPGSTITVTAEESTSSSPAPKKATVMPEFSSSSSSSSLASSSSSSSDSSLSKSMPTSYSDPLSMNTYTPPATVTVTAEAVTVTVNPATETTPTITITPTITVVGSPAAQTQKIVQAASNAKLGLNLSSSSSEVDNDIGIKSVVPMPAPYTVTVTAH
ncbi:unnamed protein product [Penicillium pancosmium]